MRTVQELNNSKAPIVRIDPSLEQYRDTRLSPEKLVKANELLKLRSFQAVDELLIKFEAFIF